MMEESVLSAVRKIDIRFSEVDSMHVVWHGNYAKYFEDAREAFGEKYGLDYLAIYGNGYFAPLVELTFKYKRPLRYGDRAEIRIFYRPTEAAKLVFDYEITDLESGEVVLTGHSVQVFMEKESYQMVWGHPEFFEAWKRKWGMMP